jgi:hypothetical protein
VERESLMWPEKNKKVFLAANCRPAYIFMFISVPVGSCLRTAGTGGAGVVARMATGGCFASLLLLASITVDTATRMKGNVRAKGTWTEKEHMREVIYKMGWCIALCIVSHCHLRPVLLAVDPPVPPLSGC